MILGALLLLSAVALGPVAWSAYQLRNEKPFVLDPDTQRILDKAENPPYDPSKNAPGPSRATASNAPDLEQAVKAALNAGAIRRVDTGRHEVQVNPLAWAGLDADGKKAFTVNLATYCAQHAHLPLHYVDVIDSQSGKKLAHYGAWGFEVF
jgi:hypothetical protein